MFTLWNSHTTNSSTSANSPKSPLGEVSTKWMCALLLASLLLAIMNSAAMWRRTFVMYRHQAQNASENSAQWVANQSQFWPSSAHIALLLPNPPPDPIWFDYRLHYLLLPKNFDLYWGHLPDNAIKKYQIVITFLPDLSFYPRDMWKKALASQWKLVSATYCAQIWVPTSERYSSLTPSSTTSPAKRANESPGFLAMVKGLLSLFLLFVVGWGILRLTSPLLVTQTVWGDLALAHLTGSTALAIALSPIAFATQRLTLPEAYLALGLALLLWGAFIQGLKWAKLFQPNSHHTHKLPSATHIAVLPKNCRDNAIKILAVLLLLLAAGVTLAQGLALGLDWDGYSIWQLKAKAFFVWNGSLRILHDYPHFFYAHLDYPLLLPLQTWWTCSHAGFYSDRWAQCVNLLFVVDTVLLLATCLARLREPLIGLIGSGLLLSMPLFNRMAMSGFADVPLAAFFLAVGTGLLFTLQNDCPSFYASGKQGIVLLTGWWLAGALLTKNEGMAIALAAFLSYLYWAGKWKKSLKEVGLPLFFWAFMGIAAALPWALQKRQWHLANDLFVPGVLHRATNHTLYHLIYIIKEWVFQLLHVGPWYPAWGLLLALVLTGLARSVKQAHASAGPLWSLVGFLLLFYTGIYLITPHNLHWHILTSMDRLILQMAPVLLLAAFLSCFSILNASRGEDTIISS